ncbi:choice-of-anchor Q domain-containing protein [Spirosoma foliorum]|uniref:DUF11 domain-containing protein n=1 Tax=Spirosoma foliorum TaxID=2710596 RepID=A0A7G5GQH8_9BACT|nr:choice-of-anchor Q domain-containing protein [Spirosoma foliorum]QMW01120.1 DUF11 domain-containing protein [Spirosoma foliorum]
MKFVLTILLFGLYFSLHSQPIVYVTPTGSGNLSGSSWTNALSGNQLRNQLALATSGMQFWLAGGSYNPGTTRTNTFQIPSGVQVYGGFNGTEIFLNNRALSTPSSTTLTGEIGDPNTIGDNVYHVITFTNVSINTQLNGVVVTRGNANASTSPDNCGGGIYNNSNGNSIKSNPTISNCQVIDNTATYSGGGLYNEAQYGGESSPTFQNCLFKSNKASVVGGGVYNYAYRGLCSPKLTDCIFTSNTANSGGGLGSAAIFNAGYNNPTFINCLFRNNSAVSGGAIHFGSSFYAFLNPSLKNCLLDHNQASENGGAILMTAVIGCSADPVLTNCIITDNSAGTTGAGIYGSCYTDSDIRIRLTNNIIWNNSFAYNNSSGNKAPVYNISYSDIQGGFSGTGNINADPLFVDATNGNYRLLRNSPCINTGDPASTTANVSSTDLVGSSRIFGGRIDMGAYEFIPYADLRMALALNTRTPAINEPVSYNLTITNDGPEPATAVGWQNQLPPNLAFVSGANVANSSNLVSGTIPSLAPGASTQFSYQVQAKEPGRYVNAAQITSSDQPDPDSQPGSGTGDGQDDTAQADLRTIVDNGTVYVSPNPNQVPLPVIISNQPPADPTKADLSLSMSASKRTLKAGDITTITLQVSNAGGLAVTGVTVKLNLPVGTSFESGSGFSVNGQTAIGSVGSISADTSTPLTAQVRVNSGNPAYLTAEILTSNQPDPDSHPNSGTDDGEDDTISIDLRVIP